MAKNTKNSLSENEIVQLVGRKGKDKFVKLKTGEHFQSTDGIIKHDEMIGKTWGTQVQSHLGKSFLMLQPALDDLLRGVKRTTQTLYPKDIGYILISMGIGPGQSIIEAGTGSGAMTIALAHAVGKDGHIYSYERRPEIQKYALENIENLDLQKQVSLKLKDIENGFDERNIRAIFMDLPNPEDYLMQVKEALIPGGFFACILPTTNQVSNLLKAFKKEYFALVEVSEILHRYYKAVARRLRPADNMNAHTGYLVFARSIQENFPEEIKG
jgi:tRNA (adenine57-N1/adenine58-N1)-methyltransferase